MTLSHRTCAIGAQPIGAPIVGGVVVMARACGPALARASEATAGYGGAGPCTGVAAVGLLHHVRGEAADRVDAQPVDVAVVELHRDRLGRRQEHRLPREREGERGEQEGARERGRARERERAREGRQGEGREKGRAPKTGESGEKGVHAIEDKENAEDEDVDTGENEDVEIRPEKGRAEKADGIGIGTHAAHHETSEKEKEREKEREREKGGEREKEGERDKGEKGEERRRIGSGHAGSPYRCHVGRGHLLRAKIEKMIRMMIRL